MKPLIALLIFAGWFSLKAQAQVAVKKQKADFASSVKNFIQPPAIGDASETTGGIVSELSRKLGLGAAEKPGLTDAISSFLGKKKEILPLADKDPSAYLGKFNPLQQDLFGKMKGIMGAAKYAKFLGLKPKDAGSLLSNLFF